jgi:hypothetical protein
MDSVLPRKVRSQAKPCEICGQNGTGTGFYQSASAASCQYHISFVDRRRCGRGWPQRGRRKLPAQNVLQIEAINSSGREWHFEGFAKKIKSQRKKNNRLQLYAQK